MKDAAMTKGPLFSPLHWHILLWYHTHPVQYAETDPAHANSPATIEYTNQLIYLGLIEPAEQWYKTTARGKALDERLALPLPVQSWNIP
jgi:hypothetical protein